jgi:hypothetical protein
LAPVPSADALTQAASGTFYDSVSNLLYIKFKDANAPFEVEIDK